MVSPNRWSSLRFPRPGFDARPSRPRRPALSSSRPATNRPSPHRYRSSSPRPRHRRPTPISQSSGRSAGGLALVHRPRSSSRRRRSQLGWSSLLQASHRRTTQRLIPALAPTTPANQHGSSRRSRRGCRSPVAVAAAPRRRAQPASRFPTAIWSTASKFDSAPRARPPCDQPQLAPAASNADGGDADSRSLIKPNWRSL